MSMISLAFLRSWAVRLGGACGVLVVLMGCPTPASSVGCKADRDCANFETCDVNTGFCLCADDQACDATEFCNGLGRCQPKLGCESNADCRSPDRPSDICDTTTNECITLNASSLQCILDSHCPFGSYCSQNICRVGCQENGDCGIDVPCINGSCDERPGACNQDGYCEYGEGCNLATNSCAPHRQANLLCQTCSYNDFTQCGGNGPCLFDDSVPPQPCSSDAQCAQWPDAYCFQQPCFEDTDCPSGTCDGAGFFLPGTCSPGYCTRTFCGSDSCNDDTDPCPRGYSCYQLITVTGTPCTLGDNSCQGGRACSAGGENSVAGYCSCINDSDCPAGTNCVNPGPNGICLQGSTCGPEPGLLCEDVE